jgi:hypothetical protein
MPLDPVREGPFDQLRREVASRARRGVSIADIESDVIQSSPVSEDSKAALWLFAWSTREVGRRGYEARQAQVRRRARGAHTDGHE